LNLSIVFDTRRCLVVDFYGRESVSLIDEIKLIKSHDFWISVFYFIIFQLFQNLQEYNDQDERAFCKNYLNNSSYDQCNDNVINNEIAMKFNCSLQFLKSQDASSSIDCQLSKLNQTIQQKLNQFYTGKNFSHYSKYLAL
jgi:hypothetical protein